MVFFLISLAQNKPGGKNYQELRQLSPLPRKDGDRDNACVLPSELILHLLPRFAKETTLELVRTDPNVYFSIVVGFFSHASSMDHIEKLHRSTWLRYPHFNKTKLSFVSKDLAILSYEESSICHGRLVSAQ